MRILTLIYLFCTIIFCGNNIFAQQALYIEGNAGEFQIASTTIDSITFDYFFSDSQTIWFKDGNALTIPFNDIDSISYYGYLNPALNYGTVTDIDGNEYKTIQIGQQEWMAENLRTSRFANGDPITNITSGAEWGNLGAFSTPAWCHLDNNSWNEYIYGKLYNFYVVMDSRNVCPTGWHVPTDLEWDAGINLFLGGYTVSGGKMKSSYNGPLSLWELYNGQNIGGNYSGFSGVPAGARISDGTFSGNDYGMWWTSTVYGANQAYRYYLGWQTEYLNRNTWTWQSGNSIRCIKDAQATIANLTTASASNVTSASAILGGNITNNGGSPVTQRGVCYSTSPGPTTANSTTNDGSGTGSFSSNLSGLTASTTYYVRAYAINSVGTAYGNEVSFTTTSGGTIATLTTVSASNVTTVSATLGGNISSDGGSPVTQRGVCYSTSPGPTTANLTTNDGSGTGSFSSSLTGLTAGTTYYVRAYAINSIGTAYGNEVSFTTTSGCTFTPTTIVDVTNPATGKIWMDRNLGATQAATTSTDVNSYGDLYQWGRGADGHQCRISTIISTLSSTDQPGHDDFIASTSGWYDWRNPPNGNLWQGVNGTNNPCPSGYRLPTDAELVTERLSWSSNNSAGALSSPLKLPVSGSRNYFGTLVQVGAQGYYWSSTVISATNSSESLWFSSSGAQNQSTSRARAYSVRCIKD